MNQTLEALGISRKQFIEKYFRVINKDKQVVPLHFNRIQELELAEQSEIGRDQYVKPAQIGSTTLWVAVALADCMSTVGNTAVIVSYDEDHASRLLLKATQFIDNMVPDFKWPTASRNNKNEIYFPDLQSTLYVGSARQYNFGRGEPIHMLVGSEVAFWPDASKILIPAQDRVPMNGQIILESTPNGKEGEGEFFYKNYVAGKTKEFEEELTTIYRSHFYPWWYHDEYQFQRDSIYALPRDRVDILTLTDEEEHLCNLHGLNDDHIRWRRRKQLEKRQAIEAGRPQLLFQQEFPEDDENCWLITSSTFYDVYLLEQLAKQCYIAPDSYKGAAIWYKPEEFHEYMVTIDPGMGKSSKSVVQVWETIEDEEGQEHDRHCATASGYWLEPETVTIAVELGKYYNNAQIAPERNIPAVAALLYERKYPYLYKQEDLINKKPTKVVGWLTTPKTKQFMFTQVSRALPTWITHDRNVVDQLYNIRNENGKIEPHGHDDYHDAAALYAVCKRGSGLTKSRFAGSTAPQDTWWAK